MKLNLQFFADDEISTGAEATEHTEALETGNEDAGNEATEGTTAEGAQTSPEENNGPDMNAIYANARRRAEAEYKKKQELRDAEYARRFGKYVNPETGQPIRSEADYLEAWDAQERVNAKKELETAGVNPQMIERLVENSPRMREAERMLADYQRQQVEQLINNDVAELNKLDPNIKSLETVPPEVMQHAQTMGISLVLAYKDLNFGKVTQQKESAIRQTTINQLSGKAHLAPANGVVAADNLVDIPANEYDTWQRGFPNLSALELKKKYNSFLNSQK